jgi:hypothetical protein
MNEELAAFLNPAFGELAKPTVKTATPAFVAKDETPVAQWYDRPTNLITFAEGGVDSKHIENGMIKSYLDRKATNPNNMSYFDDGMGKRGAYTIGRGFTYNPITGGAINENTRISPEDEIKWMNTVRKSFDKEASTLWPKYWKEAPDNEKDALMVYFHQFTGFPEHSVDKNGKKTVNIVWGISKAAPTITRLLKEGRTPKVLKDVSYQIFEGTAANRSRNRATKDVFDKGELNDYSVKGDSSQISKTPRKLKYKDE